MRQVHDYVIMDTFLKNDLQCISMGTHSNRNNEIALINEIEKGTLINSAAFKALTKHLTNLEFSNSDGKYTLVTLYNEGVPFPIYMQNYKLQNDERKDLLINILDKIVVYNELPADLLSLLIDENQIIISDGEILLNEIINLEKYDTSTTFQDSLKVILEKVLALCDSKPCYDINDYLSSDQFYHANSLIEIIDHIKQLVEDIDISAVDNEAETEIVDASIPENAVEISPVQPEPFIYKFDVDLDDDLVMSNDDNNVEAGRSTVKDKVETDNISTSDSSLESEQSLKNEILEQDVTTKSENDEIDLSTKDEVIETKIISEINAIEQNMPSKNEAVKQNLDLESEALEQKTLESTTEKTEQTALNDFINYTKNKANQMSINTTPTRQKMQTTKTNNKEITHKKKGKTRAQRRRRLIWLVVIIVIIVLLKMMWPQ